MRAWCVRLQADVNSQVSQVEILPCKLVHAESESWGKNAHNDGMTVLDKCGSITKYKFKRLGYILLIYITYTDHKTWSETSENIEY